MDFPESFKARHHALVERNMANLHELQSILSDLRYANTQAARDDIVSRCHALTRSALELRLAQAELHLALVQHEVRHRLANSEGKPFELRGLFEGVVIPDKLPEHLD